ncbi:unnamed protein product, partial [Tetraodon nigroviridis]
AEKNAICHQDSCYAVFLQKRTFREAGRSCRELYGTLATMHTGEAAGVVHQLLSRMEVQSGRLRLRLWIGLHRPPRQCSTSRPLRGFVWVTGDQDGQFTNWLREDTPGTCAAPRCVAMTVHTSESGREVGDNFRWLDGSCALPLDGYVCQYNYKGMCPPLEDEGGGAVVYTTPFRLVSSLLTHVPYGSVATVFCPADQSDPDAPAQHTVLCTERDDKAVGWQRETPLCTPGATVENQDWCSGDHGCEQFCQNTDTDYYCYCSEGFVIDEDGYGCKPDPLSQTSAPDLPSDSAGPTDQPHIKQVCVDMGCEYDCVETPRAVRCTCPPGYQMGPDGRRCSDVDECRQQPCPQLCVNIPGTFHCTCHAGYQPDDEGECVDIDECLDEGSCPGTCENTVGSFRHDIPWSTSYTLDPNFELETNLGVDLLTESPDQLLPDMTHGSDNSLNQWDAFSPKGHPTAPSPTPKQGTGNEIVSEVESKAGSRGGNDHRGVETPDHSSTGNRQDSAMDNAEETGSTAEIGAESTAGKKKHDKSWMLVALLVPLCVFLVVMLALGIVYCTSCAVDKSLSFSECYRWILPTMPPDRREGKTQA